MRSPHATLCWYRGQIVRGKGRVFQLVPRRAGGYRRARAGARRAFRSKPPTLCAVLTAAAIPLAGLLASGCGGSARQDAHESAGAFTVQVVHASFPTKQSIAQPTHLDLEVRNTGAHTVPNLAVTLNSFDYTERPYPELADNKRPIWVVEQGPGGIAKPPVRSQAVSPTGGAQTAYVNTWALGPLAPGHTQKFVWRVMPVKAGQYTVHFIVAAGLAGKAKAQLASGAPAQGQFTADIAPKPAAKHVDPNTGQVVPGALPLLP
jgi:hypothetical protein